MLFKRINIQLLEIISHGDNMKKSNVIVIYLILSISFIFCLTGCDNQASTEDTKQKVTKELDYLDTQIISISNKLNNILIQNYTITSEEVTLEKSSSGSSGGGQSSSQEESSGGEQSQSSSQMQTGSDSQKSNITTTQVEPKTVLNSNENDIDWNTIKNDIEVINEAWSVVILDLSTLNVDNNDVLGFSKALDDAILSIKDENKANTLANITKLYSFIPKFEREISAENSIQNIKQVKSYIINAYALVEQDDWTGIGTNISESEETFKNITNDLEYIKDKEYKVNKTYILLKELQNSLTYKDKKLFYVKYKNLIESINTL